MSKTRFVILVVVLICTLFGVASCSSRLIAEQMVSAPGDSLLGQTVNNQFELINQATDDLIAINLFERKRVQLAERDLTISYFDIPAADYGYTFETFPMSEDGTTIRWIHTHWHWKDKSCFIPRFNPEAKGTLLMLHGWARDNRSLISYAVEFAQMGYRVVVPDLRGHGHSSGKWLSFGAAESEDMVAFADALGLSQFDVLGFSLGATTAIHWASRDSRVNRVIAVAPMHSIIDTIPKFGSRSRPWINYLLEGNEPEIVASAQSLSGYDYSTTSDTLRAAKGLSNPTLLVYGQIDQMSDGNLNHAIYARLAGDKAIKELPQLRHTHVLQHQTVLAQTVSSWLGLEPLPAKLPTDTCTNNAFAL